MVLRLALHRGPFPIISMEKMLQEANYSFFSSPRLMYVNTSRALLPYACFIIASEVLPDVPLELRELQELPSGSEHKPFQAILAMI